MLDCCSTILDNTKWGHRIVFTHVNRNSSHIRIFTLFLLFTHAIKQYGAVENWHFRILECWTKKRSDIKASLLYYIYAYKTCSSSLHISRTLSFTNVMVIHRILIHRYPGYLECEYEYEYAHRRNRTRTSSSSACIFTVVQGHKSYVTSTEHAHVSLLRYFLFFLFGFFCTPAYKSESPEEDEPDTCSALFSQTFDRSITNCKLESLQKSQVSFFSTQIQLP